MLENIEKHRVDRPLSFMSCAAFQSSFCLQPFSFTAQGLLSLLSRMLLPVEYADPVQLGTNKWVAHSFRHIVPFFLRKNFVAQNLTVFYFAGTPEFTRARSAATRALRRQQALCRVESQARAHWAADCKRLTGKGSTSTGTSA